MNRPTKRLRVKTPPPRLAQTPVVGMAMDDEEADEKKGRLVYLVTLPHPKQAFSAEGRPLVAPGSMSQREVLDKFLACCARPVYRDARSIREARSVPVRKTGVFRELHQADPTGVAQQHDHLPIVAERMFMYLPVKRALLERYGLASHWSGTHDGYWSAIRYLVMPSPRKPEASLDKGPVLWAATEPHPPVLECCNAPLTAKAIQARREAKDKNAAEKGKQAPRVNDLDVWHIVVKNKICNTADDMTGAQQLITWAKTRATLQMQQFLFKNRGRLNPLIDDIWMWESVEQDMAVARATRLEALQSAAAAPCVCQGHWTHHVATSFHMNGIDVPMLCRDILEACSVGRSEAVPVIVLAGARGGEGKSLFLKALQSVFGHMHVFNTPEMGSFPMLELPGKKVAFLDEWRFASGVLSYATQLSWFDGSIVPINRPQNQPGVSGHIQYRGTAPIFVTSKLSDIEQLEKMGAENPRTGAPRDAEASMLLRRLKVYRFTKRIPKPPSGLPFCGHCFSRAVLTGTLAQPPPATAAQPADVLGNGVWM